MKPYKRHKLLLDGWPGEISLGAYLGAALAPLGGMPQRVCSLLFYAFAADLPVLRAQHQFVPIYSGQGGRPQTGGSLPRPANTAQGRIAQKFTGIFLCHHSSCGCFALPLQSSPELWIGASAAHGKFAKSTRQGGTLIICRGAREP